MIGIFSVNTSQNANAPLWVRFFRFGDTTPPFAFDAVLVGDGAFDVPFLDIHAGCRGRQPLRLSSKRANIRRR